MAIYSKPPNTPRIAGSRLGATFTRTPNGFIIRKRYMPKSSRNAKTTAIRAKFLTSVQRLRSLDPSNQQTFVNEAPNFVRTNSLGIPYALTNIQLATSQSFISLEQNEPLPLVASPPVTFEAISLAGSGWVYSPPLLIISTTLDPVPMNRDVIVWLSPAGDWVLGNIPHSRIREALKVPAGHTGPIDLLAAYRDTFGQERWKIGQTMYVGLQLYARNAGQKSSINYSLLGLAS